VASLPIHARAGIREGICRKRPCPAVIGHTVVWMDSNHLTGIYSAEVAGPFRAAFMRVRP